MFLLVISNDLAVSPQRHKLRVPFSSEGSDAKQQQSHTLLQLRRYLPLRQPSCLSIMLQYAVRCSKDQAWLHEGKWHGHHCAFSSLALAPQLYISCSTVAMQRHFLAFSCRYWKSPQWDIYLDGNCCSVLKMRKLLISFWQIFFVCVMLPLLDHTDRRYCVLATCVTPNFGVYRCSVAQITAKSRAPSSHRRW